ncbi:hypothetical protein GOP47_0016666 [Adiantum capillus-veneris]|uniref:Uncharacterized protein n=1 Tax=Adiantum capillus-veneris TaxID=13818 RepID=A0A9D4ZD72_ADICA|nr:hypothetical protein GOP47_0016666 [Adiantum capillus-veneris]
MKGKTISHFFSIKLYKEATRERVKWLLDIVCTHLYKFQTCKKLKTEFGFSLGGRRRESCGTSKMNSNGTVHADVDSLIAQHHTRPHASTQASGVFTQRIRATVGTVWELVRRFDNPQIYKTLITSCRMLTAGDLQVGISTRRCRINSEVAGGAESSIERLHTFDEDNHRLGFEVLGGGNRLRNYNSLTTLHADEIDVTHNLRQLALASERRMSTRSHSPTAAARRAARRPS